MPKCVEGRNVRSASRGLDLETRGSATDKTLEIKLQRKLHYSRVPDGRGNNSETATRPPSEERSGIREVGMVEGIKELGTELEPHDLPHRENLEHADIRIRESGTVVPAYAAIPELAEPG
jgi:hypothetical protein